MTIRLVKSIAILLIAGSLAACVTIERTAETEEPDFIVADEIPSRPGILEKQTGKKLEVAF